MLSRLSFTKWVLIGICLIRCAYSQEQADFKFHHLNKSAGFPVDFVYDIAFDAKGYMWATTSNGLMRYNGQSAKIFASDSSEIGLLPSFLYHLYIDREQKIWLIYFDAAISRFDPETEQFQHFKFNPEDTTSLPDGQVSEFFEDSKGNLWLGTWGGGMARFDRTNQSFERFQVHAVLPDSLSSQVVTCFAEEQDGTFLIGTWEGEGYQNFIFHFDPETKKFSRFTVDEYEFENEIERGKVQSEAFRIVHFIEIDEDNNLWVGTYSGLFYVNRTEMTIRRVTGLDKGMLYWLGHVTFDNTIKALYDSENNLWVSTEVGGIMVVDLQTHQARYVNKQIENGTSLSGDQIRGMTKDAYGNIWLSTEGGGVDVYSSFEQQFKIVSNAKLLAIRQNKAQGLYAINQFLVSTDHTEIVVGHGNGATIYSLITGQSKWIDLQKPYDAFLAKNPEYLEYNRNNPNYVMDISEFPGHYIFGTHIGLVIYDRETNKVDFSFIHTYRDLGAQRHMYGDKMVGFRHYHTHEGFPDDTTRLQITKFNPLKGDLETELEIPYERAEYGRYTLYFHDEIDTNILLVAYNNKMFFTYDLRNKQLKEYSALAPLSNAPDTNLMLLYTDNFGIAWFDSPSGLYSFDYKSGKFEHLGPYLNLSEKDGIRSINRDQSGKVWVALAYDLIRFDPETHESFRFTSKHGLDVGAFVKRRTYRTDLDKIIFPVNYGLLMFDPSKIAVNTKQSHMLLTDLIIAKDTLTQDRIGAFMKDQPRLAWNENLITFEFASDMLYSPGGKLYEYRLIGLDTTWVQAGGQTKVTYTNLKAGTYVFEARCIDSFGVYSDTLEVPFKIDQPFWLKWWFILLEIFVFFGLVWLVVRIRERRLRRSKFILEKTVELRTTQVRDKIHEIERQKDIIESKNRELTDSIQYAKRIQETLLASEEQLQKFLPEFFILYKPKDIVSGDFYWAVYANGSFYLAVCDSTGHGVPGAFMSLLNIRFLYEAIVEKKIAEPNLVLDFVRNRLVESVSKDGGKDGMDGTLIRLERDSSRITYASAQNRPVLFRSGTPAELESDKMPIGLGERKDAFRLFTIDFQKGDALYFFTDGFSDQFGGANHGSTKPGGKKLKRKRLIELLQKSAPEKMSSQKENLTVFFDEWKGDLEQVDDVLVIGFRF